MSHSAQRARRLYRRMLQLYPAEFRSAFATDMERQFADEYREAETAGAKRGFLLAALLDVLATAPGELARGLREDLHHALRLYSRNLGGTAVAVAVLAIGMACVSALLSLYADVAFKPFPGVEDGARLVTIAQVNDVQQSGITLRFTETIDEEVSAIEAATGVASAYQEIRYASKRVRLEYVSDGFFDVVKPKLALGRGFAPSEYSADAEPTVVLSHRMWQEQLGGRPDVVGETIELNAPSPNRVRRPPMMFRVIGVTAPKMRGILSGEVDLWLPVEQFASLLEGGGTVCDCLPAERYAYTIARLKPGASRRSLLRELEGRYPDPNETFGLGGGFRLDVAGGVVADVHRTRAVERQLQLFLAGSLLLAFVAAANVSLFLLARAPGRRRELAIRMATGAPMKRLVRQLMTESSLLVIVAGALGLLGSIWFGGFLAGTDTFRRADWDSYALLDWRVLSLVACFVAILALCVSLAPILGLRKIGVANAARQIAARASPAQRIAGTIQMMIAGGVGGVAVAFIWFLGAILFEHPGYEVDGRYAVNFLAHGPRVDDAAAAAVEASRIREVIEALPGVDAISFSLMVPGQNISTERSVRDPVDPSRERQVLFGAIDERFVDVLGLNLVHGRSPAANEIGVSLVNESLARLLFGRDDVVGETLELGAANMLDRDIARTTQIVGVLEDVSFRHPGSAPDPMLFTSVPLAIRGLIGGIVASPLTVAQLHEQLQTSIDFGALDVAGIGSLVSLADFRDRRIAPDRVRALMTIAVAGVVLLLTGMGFYGTERYLVAAGRREYAIRSSLGASPKSLALLVLQRSMMLAMPGLVAGALLAFALVAWLRDEYLSRQVLPGVTAAVVVLGIAVLMLAATLGPAREASRTQPGPLLGGD